MWWHGYCLGDGEVRDFSLDGALHHRNSFFLVLADSVVLLVGLETGSVLVLGDRVLGNDEVFLGLVEFGHFGAQVDPKVVLGELGLEFGVDSLREGNAVGVHLVLDFLAHLAGAFEGDGKSVAVATGQVVDDGVGQRQPTHSQRQFGEGLLLVVHCLVKYYLWPH